MQMECLKVDTKECLRFRFRVLKSALQHPLPHCFKQFGLVLFHADVCLPKAPHHRKHRLAFRQFLVHLGVWFRALQRLVQLVLEFVVFCAHREQKLRQREKTVSSRRGLQAGRQRTYLVLAGSTCNVGVGRWQCEVRCASRGSRSLSLRCLDQRPRPSSS